MRKGNNGPVLSSLLTNPAAILALFTISAATAFYRYTAGSLFFGFLFFLALSSYIWGWLSLKNLTYTMQVPEIGIFPGQSVFVKRVFHNGKVLPLVWLELVEELDMDGCLLPGEEFIADVTNPPESEGEREYRAIYAFSLLKWHQTLSFSDPWRAQRRGVHITRQAVVRSGDGFGLCARDKVVRFDPARRVVVYPQIVPVSVDRILNDIWDTYSSSRGYLEDNSVLRSVRDYLPSDPARRINNRMLARGQGMKVNQYEVVAPSDVFFILDCASFSGEGAQSFEDTLSVLASLIAGLTQGGVRTGLATPGGRYGKQSCLLPSAGQDACWSMLEKLSEADTSDQSLQGVPSDLQAESLGQTYYFTYSAKKAASLSVLGHFQPHKTKLVTYDLNAWPQGQMEYPVLGINLFWRAS